MSLSRSRYSYLDKNLAENKYEINVAAMYAIAEILGNSIDFPRFLPSEIIAISIINANKNWGIRFMELKLSTAISSVKNAATVKTVNAENILRIITFFSNLAAESSVASIFKASANPIVFSSDFVPAFLIAFA